VPAHFHSYQVKRTGDTFHIIAAAGGASLNVGEGYVQRSLSKVPTDSEGQGMGVQMTRV